MRWLCALLLLAVAAAAQPAAPKQDPFAPLDANFRPGVSVFGTEARVGEALALLKAALDKHPADVDALERALPLLAKLGRLPLFRVRLDRALRQNLSATDRARLRSVRGRALVQSTGSAFLLNNLPQGLQGMNAGDLERLLKQLNKPSKASMTLARPDLEAAVKALPNDWRAREALAQVLTVLDPKAHAETIGRLLMNSAALRVREQGAVAPPVDYAVQSGALREQAEGIEQAATNPQHEDALPLRRRALILWYCTYTIPFEPDIGLWDKIALLAPESIVQESLTRTFRTKKGEISSVGVQYYQPPTAKRIEVIEALGKIDNPTAAAALLSVLRRARAEDPTTAAAVRAARQKAIVERLPVLLATALFSMDETEYPRLGRRLLVALAGELVLQTTAPVLRRALAADHDLWVPLGVARALGKIGRAEDADALLAAARDRSKDIYFRREAAEALGRIAPDRLSALEDDAQLEIALAAARYRLEPNKSDLGRILAGLDRMHECDEAARFCAELKIRESLPALETYLDDRGDHYAAQSVRRSHEQLLASLRGG